MPPNTKKGGAGTANPEHRPHTHQGVNDKNKVAEVGENRSTLGRQTPIARFLLVHENRPGRRTADAIPLDHCPVCGYQSSHKTAWPPQETITKACTACGYRDQFATIAVKAGSRRRRSA
ncbi:hypothetical protein E1292_35310 [Nonomuraea deserti]|uniref:Uncharacterized protein n=1 Tax=Nonomuraea deserti TaxID=1848322 RepID=A0A4R4V0E1_9ACTN|nr:hypothetical protein [Nonomuraea deserti]TDC98508.1 hypothetical protein E1292_35310 [Nonomuraea deserti]